MTAEGRAQSFWRNKHLESQKLSILPDGLFHKRGCLITSPGREPLEILWKRVKKVLSKKYFLDTKDVPIRFIFTLIRSESFNI